jgi:endonuclease/exonuclease/phosphatase family metal-dependent hydrolase
MGRIDTHIAALSRFAVDSATRIALSPLTDGWLRRQLDLKRAILEITLPMADGRRWTVLDTHLSAFSRGDGTLQRQVAQIEARLDVTQAPWLLAGDFNALPPGDDARRLGLDAVDYPEAASPIAPLFGRGRSAIPLEEHQRRPEAWRTWMPWGSSVPERALDHAFVSDDVAVARASVLHKATALSDHLPIRMEVVLPR